MKIYLGKLIFIAISAMCFIDANAEIPFTVITLNKPKPDTVLIYNPYGYIMSYTSTDTIINCPANEAISNEAVLKIAAKGYKLVHDANDHLVYAATGSLYKDIKRIMQYPPDAKKRKIHGIVVIGFKLDSLTSKIIAPYVYKSLYPSLDAEAVRIMKNMPVWNWGHPMPKTIKNFDSRILIKF